MFNAIREIFSLLSHKQKKEFYILQFLVILMAFTELLGIASIAPFMALVGDTTLLEKNEIYASIYEISGFDNSTEFLFFSGLCVLIALSFSALVSMYTTWKLALYATKVGVELSDRLYTFYLQQDWMFHASGSSAQLVKQVSTEANRISVGIINPLLQMNAKLVLAVLISISLIIYNPLIALIGILLFVISYVLLYKIVRVALSNYGKRVSEVWTSRFKLMNEGFGGVKDVILLNRSHDFINRFSKEGISLAHAQGTSLAMGQVPRFFIELLAFGAMIGLVLILIKTHQGNLGEILPILSVYALACFKLLPALQQVYSSITTIKSNLPAFESVKNDLYSSKEALTPIHSESLETINLRHQIHIKNIEFSYPSKDRLALDSVNMIIPVNHVIGIVGSSGSGKSTLIDIILGLIMPQNGEIYVDDNLITENNKRGWQNLLGFVPQSIFLSEGSIAENIAFGIPADEINYKQVEKALVLAHLTELVNELPEGVHTKVGERGVQLSGGQRQRIGIARALYNEADVLIFDEATSALDGITEKIIMDAIHEFTGKKTIIMIAHRLKTVQKCDTIYLMEKGKVIDQGTYEHLVANNPKFREMAKHS